MIKGVKEESNSEGDRFQATHLQALATTIGGKLDILAPVEDRPSYYLLFVSNAVCEWLGKSGGRPQQYLVQQDSTSIYRSTYLAIEVLHGRDAYYVVFPPDADSAERMVEIHWQALKLDATPDWNYHFISVLRQPKSEVEIGHGKRLFGGAYVHCGDFLTDSEWAVPYRLYLGACRVDRQSVSRPFAGV